MCLEAMTGWTGVESSYMTMSELVGSLRDVGRPRRGEQGLPPMRDTARRRCLARRRLEPDSAMFCTFLTGGPWKRILGKKASSKKKTIAAIVPLRMRPLSTPVANLAGVAMSLNASGHRFPSHQLPLPVEMAP